MHWFNSKIQLSCYPTLRFFSHDYSRWGKLNSIYLPNVHAHSDAFERKLAKPKGWPTIGLSVYLYLQKHVIEGSEFYTTVFISLNIMRAWIAEWYHTWLCSLVHCAMPSTVSMSHGNNKLFFRPKHNIYAFFMILFGLFDLMLLFVCQTCHVNCETEYWKYKKFI